VVLAGRPAHDARVPRPVIFQHPLAYLAALEGLALVRAFAGEHDEAFTRARLGELRDLLDAPERFGTGTDVRPLTAGEAYDGWAPSYDGPNTLFEMEEPALLPILDALPPGRAVDAACGTGRIAARLHAREHTVQGYDVSAGMLAVARGKLPDVTFGVADVRDLPVADDSADLLTVTLALSHIEDLGPVFAEAARVLTRGGHLVVSDSRGHLVGSRLQPLPQETSDGRVGYLPNWRHGTGEYVRVALAHGFVVRACEEPVRPPMDAGDWDPPEPHEPGEPPSVWALMGAVPAAAHAAYLDAPAVIVWDFELT
jgi:SAM-dependent methyltransferase